MISAIRRLKRHDETDVVPPSGIACSVVNCLSVDAQICSYRDRWRRACGVACCHRHNVSLGGATYCRRHAGTVRAITAPPGHPSAVPDLQDRAPSLINWIANDIDQGIRTLLARAARSQERVIADGYVQLIRDNLRRTRWERSWRIVHPSDLVLKVSLYMDAGDDARIHVRVGDLAVCEGVPPWIERRRHGDEVAVSIDIAQRQRFYGSIEKAIAEALQDGEHFRRG